ncbi:MAG: VWA domain-containing protein, partial [Clostridiaceae bacterium]|nr:VWA domain-containing protein [Clostridiaceae bacterium]
MNKNMFNKVICFVIALMMFMPALPGNLAMASDGISWPNPGAINLTKEAEPVTETENQWEITLTIEGKNIQKTSKVVLVIDKSGSMGSGSKLANTKLAAKEFVDKLLLQDKSTEIAIVTFDASPHTIKNFIGYGNAGEGKTELKNAIDGISASGGTNIQAGIHRAQELLDGVTADNKVIVLLGDGEPTHSYRVTGVTGITLTGHTGWPFNNPVIEYNNPQITAVNYNERVGSGSSYSLTSSYRYQIPCQTHGTHSTNFPANNGIPTIYEAGVSKEKGTDIYSIALNAGSNGQSVLNQSQNKGYYQLNSSDLSGLQGVFQQIAGSIVNAATNGTVTDPMGDMFDLITSIDDIYVSQGEILSVGAEHPHLITWYVGDVLEGVPAIMKYTVQIKAEADADTMYPTNDETTFEYTDAYGEETSKEFDIPEASIGGGSILYKGYLVDEDGNPISGDGEIVDRPDLAYRLYDKSLSDTPLPYTTYDVTPDEMEEYEYVKYVLNGDEGTEVPVSVLLQASKPTETVWFGYILKSQDDDTLPYTVEYYKDGIKFKTISGEVPVSNPEVQAEDVPSHMPDGYIPGPGSSQFPFTVSPDNNVIRIYYINESPEPELVSYTVQYLDKDTEEPVAPEKTGYRFPGEEVTENAIDVDNYMLAPDQQNEKQLIINPEGINVITFWYVLDEEPVFDDNVIIIKHFR